LLWCEPSSAAGSSVAEARQRTVAREPICDNRDVMRPCAYQPNFLAGVRAIRVKSKREKIYTQRAPRDDFEQVNREKRSHLRCAATCK
jgi:hypothetical protein